MAATLRCRLSVQRSDDFERLRLTHLWPLTVERLLGWGIEIDTPEQLNKRLPQDYQQIPKGICLRGRPWPFVGLSRIAQHRLVYDALADLMVDEIHAVSVEVVGK